MSKQHITIILPCFQKFRKMDLKVDEVTKQVQKSTKSIEQAQPLGEFLKILSFVKYLKGDHFNWT